MAKKPKKSLLRPKTKEDSLGEIQARIKVLQKAPIFKSIIIGFIGWGLGGNLLIIGQKLSDPVTTAICAAMMPIFGAIVELIQLVGRRG